MNTTTVTITLTEVHALQRILGRVKGDQKRYGALSDDAGSLSSRLRDAEIEALKAKLGAAT